MKIGLVGFPGSGKSTVFGALTGLDVETGFGARRDKANIGVVKVPDPRVDALAEIFRKKKTIYAEIIFTDLAAGAGEGVDRNVLNAMRSLDALCQVVRAFPDPSGAPPDPLREIAELETETILADLEVVEQRAARLRKDRSSPRELELLERLQAALEQERTLRRLELGPEEHRMIAGYSLLTLKPLLLVLNVPEEEVQKPPPADVVAAAEQRGLGVVVLSAQVEMEIAQMAEAEQQEFVASLGLEEPARNRFIRAAFELHRPDLDAHGRPRRVPRLADGARHASTTRSRQDPLGHRARLHPRRGDGLRRPRRARQRGEVPRGRQAARRGKEYVIQDGDVVHFRFNV